MRAYSMISECCTHVCAEHTAHASFDQLGANLAKEVANFIRSEGIEEASGVRFE